MLRFRQMENGGVEAAKFFDTPFFSSGILYLNPQAEKPEETVLLPEVCRKSLHWTKLSQVFYVVCCQKESLEVHIGDEIRHLSVGDSFHIPAGNKYWLKNNSVTKQVKLAFFLTCGHASSSSSAKQ